MKRIIFVGLAILVPLGFADAGTAKRNYKINKGDLTTTLNERYCRIASLVDSKPDVNCPVAQTAPLGSICLCPVPSWAEVSGPRGMVVWKPLKTTH